MSHRLLGTWRPGSYCSHRIGPVDSFSIVPNSNRSENLEIVITRINDIKLISTKFGTISFGDSDTKFVLSLHSDRKELHMSIKDEYLHIPNFPASPIVSAIPSGESPLTVCDVAVHSLHDFQNVYQGVVSYSGFDEGLRYSNCGVLGRPAYSRTIGSALDITFSSDGTGPRKVLLGAEPS